MTDADLLSWLTAQLDHDEQTARAATAGPWRVAADTYSGETDAVIVESVSASWGDRPARVAGPGYEGGGVWLPDDATHIVLHDPDRVLRDVAGKRRIVVWCRSMDPYPAPGGILAGEARKILRWLASAYSDRPGYDPSWTVE